MTEIQAINLKAGQVLKDKDNTLWIVQKVRRTGGLLNKLDYVILKNAAHIGYMTWMDIDFFTAA